LPGKIQRGVGGVEEVKDLVVKVKEETARIIVGQEQVIEGVLLALVTGGHALLEGPPGVAKTLIAKTLAQILGIHYKRVQFTPDLMPLDIIGANIFDLQKQEFVFKPGPVFTDILLADEINRTPPKTQAALLEAMEERQVTVDGQVHPLSEVFTVLATQNPLEYEGTYPLPEAQLDRFLLKIKVSYPEDRSEEELYRRFQDGPATAEEFGRLTPVLDKEKILWLREMVKKVTVREELFTYVKNIVRATREHHLLNLGVSPRGGLSLLRVAKTAAAFAGRDYLIPDDIRDYVLPVLRHRLLVKAEAQIEGVTGDQILERVLAGIPVPR
jgi:MoxR-like ATPase